MHKLIQVYEFDTLFLNHTYSDHNELGNKVRFEKKHFDALLKYNELHQSKYFAAVYEGIRFKSYVGVVQVDDLIIEILPKIQRTPETVDWRGVLIAMLRRTEKLKVNQVGNAFVDKQQIHLLDIYFDLFLTEVEKLQHRGLVKQYYTETKNTLALKGKLEFGGHIQKNLVHQQRFYTTHQVYGADHLIHQILQLALEIVEKMSRSTYRYGRVKAAQLHFPEVRDIHVNNNTFERLLFSRKTEPYRTAIEIARLIILNYAPNVKTGAERMLALLFNMNDLWEQYVLVKLRELAPEWKAEGQTSKLFWKSKTMRPDIVLTHEISKNVFVIDTKWKNYSYDAISSQDLRQIYVYADYWNAVGGMLLYPHYKNESESSLSGRYHGKEYIAKIGLLSILDIEGKLKGAIGSEVIKWLTID